MNEVLEITPVPPPSSSATDSRNHGDDKPIVVAIVTYNSEAVLGGCLASLPAALSPHSYVVVIADNASHDDTEASARALLSDVRLIQMGRNAGYSAGINATVAAAPSTGPVLVLNPDVRLQPGCVDALIRGLEQESVGITVPRLVDSEGRLQYSLRRQPSVLRAFGEALLGGSRSGRFAALGETVVNRAAYERPGRADWATGAAWLISESCRSKVGEWDESFFLYSEETDYAQRAAAVGLALHFVPDAHAVHIGGESKTSPELWSLLVRNRIRLYRRHHGRARAGLFWIAVTVNEAIRAAAGRVPSRVALKSLLAARPLF